MCEYQQRLEELRPRYRGLSREKRKKILRSLLTEAKESNDAEVLALLEYTWWLWAHDNQMLPPGNWHKLLVLCGRAWGKTRFGAEMVIQHAQDNPGTQIALVGRTLKDVRRIMIDSPRSGLLVRSPPWFEARFVSTRSEVIWPNGSKALMFSSEEPESLRGPEYSFAWADELCAWIDIPRTWSNLLFGMRLGDNPKVIVTTTPKPQPLVRELNADPSVPKIRGKTWDNIDNLPTETVADLVKTYGGSRLGRQELEAEILDALEGALWKMERRKLPDGSPDLSDTPGIEDLRISPAECPELTRCVMGIDPAVSTNPWSDLTGIVIGGLGVDGGAYILEDASDKYKPNEWAAVVFDRCARWRVWKIVVETNRGGELVESNLRNYAGRVNAERALARAQGQENVPPDLVVPAIEVLNAQQGKSCRAEPISTLYEQGGVRHVGTHGALEDEMTTWIPPNVEEDEADGSTRAGRKRRQSPNRIDALVYVVAELKPTLRQHVPAEQIRKQHEPNALQERVERRQAVNPIRREPAARFRSRWR